MIARLSTRFLFATEIMTSVPGNKPPKIADSAPGRYAGSLFSAASSRQSLGVVLEDMIHVNKIISGSEELKEFLKNSAIKRTQQRQVFGCFANDNYNQLTVNFFDAVIDAGRLAELHKMVQMYIAYCKILNKEEDIKIISAKELSEAEKLEVVAAVKKGRPDVTFKMSYQVDPNILGGLQIFAGTQFLDCSLRSRMSKLKSELSKMI